jgi:hypothetical protein
VFPSPGRVSKLKFAQFVPKIGRFSTFELNLPQLIQYAGYIPYNQSQTCVIFSQLICGFYVQFYLRNYRPSAFKNYSYLITGAFDGASLLALFIRKSGTVLPWRRSSILTRWGSEFRGVWCWGSVCAVP